MYARVATRSFRVQGTPALLRTTQPYIHSRTYAKHNKPRRTTDDKSPTLSPPVTKQSSGAVKKSSGGVAAAATGGFAASRRGADENTSSERREEDVFASDAGTQLNSEPVPRGPGPGTAPIDQPTAKPSSHPDYSKLQDEFDSSSSPDANTTPQASSPSAIDPAQAAKHRRSQPLPDLTKGIPFTLDAELAQAGAGAKESGLDVREEAAESTPSASGGKAGGELPRTIYISSADRKRERLANYMYAFLFGSITVSCVWLGRNWDDEEEEHKHPDAPSGWGPKLFYNRAQARLTGTMDYFTEPTFPKLLPNVDPAMERPYTLVLSLEDLLVHSEWTREHGWRMAKRPGVDYFLRYLSQYYELVIFTSLPSMTADPIIRKLDPYRIVMWPLFREATRYKGGEYIKDLSYLNRNLSKVILIDTSDAHAKLQPENAIILPKWKGSLQDKDLVSLIPFLEYVATMGFEDTRSVLKSFENKHIPTEYAKRESIAREKFQKEWAEERGKRPKRTGVGLLGSALGLGRSPGAGMDGTEPSLSEGFEQGKTLMDQVRERGQKQYEMLEKEIRENGHKWLEEMAAEEKKFQEEQMKNMKGSGVMGMFMGGGGGESK